MPWHSCSPVAAAPLNRSQSIQSSSSMTTEAGAGFRTSGPSSSTKSSSSARWPIDSAPMGAERAGNIELTTFDLARQGRPTTTVLHAGLEDDDHDTPALLALPDERILAIYATHGSDKLIRYRRSTGPEDGMTWEPETPGRARRRRDLFQPLFAVRGQPRPWATLRLLPGRALEPELDHLRRPGRDLAIRRTLDRFRRSGPYVKYASNGRDAIHFVATEHHPHNYPNSLYHGYLKDGRIHRSDSTVICPVSDAPIRPEQATMVFAGDEDHVAWMCDIHLDENELPCVVYSVQKQLDPNEISYRYARWDGRTWQNHFLAHAGDGPVPTRGPLFRLGRPRSGPISIGSVSRPMPIPSQGGR